MSPVRYNQDVQTTTITAENLASHIAAALDGAYIKLGDRALVGTLVVPMAHGLENLSRMEAR